MFNARRYRNLLEAARRDRNERRFWNDLETDLAGYSANEFSVRQIWEAFVDDGREILDMWAHEMRGYGNQTGIVSLEESGVTTVAFARITEKIFGDMVLATWAEPIYIADRLVETRPTRYLDGEKMAGLSNIGDMIDEVGEGMPYPMGGVSEEWIETPRTTKYGLIVPVTKEALIADRTGELQDRCQSHARALRVNKEKRVLDTVLGISNTYRRNGGPAQNTYGTTHTQGDFSNLNTSNPLDDYSAFETSDNSFNALVDPNTGDPITVIPDTILCADEKRNLANLIKNATEVRITNGSTLTVAPNPLNLSRPDGITNIEEVVSNKFVKTRLAAAGGVATTWYRGQPRMAFGYAQVWPITTTRAPRDSHLEFYNDIVESFKVSERGVPFVKEPRYMQKNTAG